jgi:hypothetical protein
MPKTKTLGCARKNRRAHFRKYIRKISLSRRQPGRPRTAWEATPSKGMKLFDTKVCWGVKSLEIKAVIEHHPVFNWSASQV